MNFWRAGIFLSPLQMADSSAVTRRSSAFLSTTLSGFVFSADVIVNVTPMPSATRLSIVVGLFTSLVRMNGQSRTGGERIVHEPEDVLGAERCCADASAEGCQRVLDGGGKRGRWRQGAALAHALDPERIPRARRFKVGDAHRRHLERGGDHVLE